MFNSLLIICSCLVVACFCLPGQLFAQVSLTDADGKTVEISDRSRIVSLGGPVTEVVCALGFKQNIVATDISSTYPSDLENLPKLGYWRALAAEGILAFEPSLIIVSELAGPEHVIDQLRNSGIPLVRVPETFSIDGARDKILMLATALDAEERGQALIRTLDAQMNEAKSLLQASNSSHRVLMLYLRGPKVLNAAGTDTPVDFMLNWSNSVNVFSDLEGWKPVSAEAIIERVPELLLVTTSGLESVGGLDGLLKIPGVAQTPAGLSKRVIVIDDLLLLGFGPRLGEALLELVNGLQHTVSEQH